MKIEVVCYGVMKEYLPAGAEGNSASIEIVDAGTVADVVQALGAPDRLVHAVLVNEDPSGLHAALSEGDRLTLMPHYSGGQR